MRFFNKKDPTVQAVLDHENEKYKTVGMIYVTGPDAGKYFDITTATLHSQWEKMDTTQQEDDMAQINAPYRPNVTPHYIPKPQSVIDYENSKKRSLKGKNKVEFEMPSDYEVLAELLVQHNVIMKNVNKGYISLPDNSKIKLQATSIGVLASNELAESFVAKGFESKVCIEKGTPFRFDVKTQQQYDDFFEILETTQNTNKED